MSWLRRHRSERPRAAEQPPAPPEPEVHRSLALAELWGELPPESRLSVLDLGPAVGSNLDFLSERFRCRLRIADLWREAARNGRLADPETDPEALFGEVLPLDGEPADLVLAWDLFDYLGRDQIRALSGRLADACRPGGRLFAMVHIGREIPYRPLTYELREGGELVYRPAGTATRPAPRYRPADVEALTPGFTVDRTYLLRHGIEEYLLIRR